MVSPLPTHERQLHHTTLQAILLEDHPDHDPLTPTSITLLSPRATLDIGVYVGPRGTIRVTITETTSRLFVYEGSVDTGEYVRLKEAESLRVEFDGFGGYVVGLLRRCEEEGVGFGRGKGFGVVLRLGERGLFEVVECNEFRSLGHLKIGVLKGGDEIVKVVLAERLKGVFGEVERLRERLGVREGELGRVEEELGRVEGVVGALRSVEEKLRKEKEIWEKEKEGLLYKANLVPGLKGRLGEVEREVRRLRDVEEKLEGKSRECEVLKGELGECERRRSDAEDVARREKGVSGEAMERVKRAVEEVRKGNEIIEKLEKEVEALRGRSRIRGSIITRQEQVIKEQEEKLDETTREVRRLREKLEICELEKNGVERRLERAQSKLEENSDLLRDDERVIRYLNKKLNERMSRKGARLLPGSTTSSTSGDSENERREAERSLSRRRRRSKSTSPPKTAGLP